MAQFTMIGALLALVVLVGSFPVTVQDPTGQPVLVAERISLPGLAAAMPTSGTQSIAARPVPLTVISANTSADTIVGAADHTDATVRAFQAEQASAVNADADTSVAASERIPIHWEHQVAAGDTLSSLAERYGVTEDSIRWNNPDLQEDLTVGETLAIPSVDGIVHSARTGETIYSVADKYDANASDIESFRANRERINADGSLVVGEQILVPGGRIVPLAPPPVVAQPPSTTPGGGTSVSGWTWPVNGTITSFFTPWHPLGIDIAAPYGTPVYAAAGGWVTFVGGNTCCSYGTHVIIDHGNGVETLYAHFDTSTVAVWLTDGQPFWVNAGDYLGSIGLTGKTTGPHCHFEVRQNGVYTNPLDWLP